MKFDQVTAAAQGRFGSARWRAARGVSNAGEERARGWCPGGTVALAAAPAQPEARKALAFCRGPLPCRHPRRESSSPCDHWSEKGTHGLTAPGGRSVPATLRACEEETKWFSVAAGPRGCCRSLSRWAGSEKDGAPAQAALQQVRAALGGLAGAPPGSLGAAECLLFAPVTLTRSSSGKPLQTRQPRGAPGTNAHGLAPLVGTAPSAGRMI